MLFSVQANQKLTIPTLSPSQCISVGLGDTTVLMRDGAKHAEARRLFNQAIGKGNVSKFNPLVEAEMLKLVLGLMNAKDRDTIIANIRR